MTYCFNSPFAYEATRPRPPRFGCETTALRDAMAEPSPGESAANRGLSAPALRAGSEDRAFSDLCRAEGFRIEATSQNLALRLLLCAVLPLSNAGKEEERTLVQLCLQPPVMLSIRCAGKAVVCVAEMDSELIPGPPSWPDAQEDEFDGGAGHRKCDVRGTLVRAPREAEF